MRMGLRILSLCTLIAAALTLAGCGSPGIDRVNVTWETDPPPTWGLYPGYRQEIPCPPNAVYRVEVFSKGKSFTSGTIAAIGPGLAFRPIAGSGAIEAQATDATHLAVYATLRDKNGAANRRLVLRVERKGDKIYFEFPK